ncbi:RNA polymerase sigma factor [Schumannella soli]|nr:sigma-70 family RNA polymerase sigma factor [Schumannella soli]
MENEQRGATQTDDELIIGVRRGDKDAFADLMEKYDRAVFRYAWGMVDRSSDVDDVVQETFLTAWRRRRHLSGHAGSALPWLLVTCRFVAFNHNRRVRRRGEVELNSDVDAPSALDRTRALEELRWVMEEIDSLSSVDRELCLRCLIDGQKYGSAAADLGISPAAARKRVERSRKRLVLARDQAEQQQ